MENQILTDPMVKPDINILENALGKNYGLFNEFVEKISVNNFILEWNYYNDGKSWLCKILNKKKNMGWLSVWNTGFKITVFFTERTINGVYGLNINDDVKTMAKETKFTGKLLLIILLIKNKKALSDGLKLLEYKMTLK